MPEAPGTYLATEALARPPALQTGVPLFVGYVEDGPEAPLTLTRAAELEGRFRLPAAGYLAAAVRGFFANGGRACRVLGLSRRVVNPNPADFRALYQAPGAPVRGTPQEALADALEQAEEVSEIDLLCLPDLTLDVGADAWPGMQSAAIAHCDAVGDRLAVLDAPPTPGIETALAHRREVFGVNGALYFPWLHPERADRLVPPCGHVAGVVARTDEEIGVHRAPAGAALHGVVDLAAEVGDAGQARLNPAGINCLRTFPGRGIRVWGARTMSRDPAWTYVNVRRLFLTAARWFGRELADVVYEPHDPGLWARVERELSAFLEELFRRGGLRGEAPGEAFYVRCDAETNPPPVREAGRLVVEVGLAAARPGEFVVVQLVQHPAGVEVARPAGPIPSTT